MRSFLAYWIGGAASTPRVVKPGYRSLLAFWAGGASCTVGSPVTTTTGGHYLPEHLKKHRHALKKHQEALDIREAEKLFQARALRKQLEELFNPPVEELFNSSVIEQSNPPDQAIDLQASLQAIESEIQLIHDQMIKAALERRRLQDEDDIAAIMMAITFH